MQLHASWLRGAGFGVLPDAQSFRQQGLKPDF